MGVNACGETVMSAREFAAWHFGGQPSRSQVNSILAQCRDGGIRNAEKLCGSWHINCTREWPVLFPRKEER